jgi:hypothetical protein
VAWLTRLSAARPARSPDANGRGFHHRRDPALQEDLRRASALGTLVHTIYKAPSSSADGNLRTGFFLDLLRRGLSTDDVQQQLDTAIDWCRYAELFDYDTDTGQIALDPDRWSTPTITNRAAS